METDESIEILDEENGDDINDVGDQPPYTVIPVIDARVAPTIVESDSNAQVRTRYKTYMTESQIELGQRRCKEFILPPVQITPR